MTSTKYSAMGIMVFTTLSIFSLFESSALAFHPDTDLFGDVRN